jgi:hypothetical protein
MLRGAFARAELVEVVFDELEGAVVVPLGVQVLLTEALEDAVGGFGGSGVVEPLGVLLLFVVVVLEPAGGGGTLRDGRSSFCPSAIISPVSLFSVFTSSIH